MNYLFNIVISSLRYLIFSYISSFYDIISFDTILFISFYQIDFPGNSHFLQNKFFFGCYHFSLDVLPRIPLCFKTAGPLAKSSPPIRPKSPTHQNQRSHIFHAWETSILRIWFARNLRHFSKII